MLHAKADELLLKICQYFISTGRTEIPATEISTDTAYDQYFTDLISSGYITQKQDINETIVLLDKAISFANQLR